MKKNFLEREIRADDYPFLIKAIRECNREGATMEVIYESPTKTNSMIVHIMAKRDPVDYFSLGSKFGTWRTEPWYGPWRYLKHKYGVWRPSRSMRGPDLGRQLSFSFE